MKSRPLGAVSACVITFVSLSAHAASVSGQGTWETTLEGRDLDGNAATFEAYYDTTLDITWLADANANGIISWDAANTWTTTLDVNGVTGWRLPTVTDVGNDGATYTNIYQGVDYGYNIDTANGEMAYMFYDTLGNTATYDTSGVATGLYGS